MRNYLLRKKNLLLLPILLFVIIKVPTTSFINTNIIPTYKSIFNSEYARLIIPKININQELYSIDNKKNNVDENITILKESILPDKDNSIVFIAAHSGNGQIAYFERLDELEIGDEITLKYNNTNYIYQVKDIWEDKKNGYININKESKKQLVLTTCSPDNEGYQLIVNCTEKEPT